jgi:intracellular septation protein
MKLLFDFFPVLAFFLAYYLAPDRSQAMYVATTAAIAAAVIQVSGWWLIKRRFEKMHVITLIIILVLGGATLVTRDKFFFMWKPTAVNWLFALAFLASEFIGAKPMIQRMMDHAITAPGHVWTVLNRSWIIFFILMGALNLYVAYNFAEHVWVNFKMFGILGITIVFAIIQSFYMSRYVTEITEGKE